VCAGAARRHFLTSPDTAGRAGKYTDEAEVDVAVLESPGATGCRFSITLPKRCRVQTT